MRLTPRGGVRAREAPPDKAKECIADPVASSALASEATDGGVRTLDQSFASRFGVLGLVGSQAFGGGERAAILAVFVVLVPASHGGSGLAGCLALVLWFASKGCLAAHPVAHGRSCPFAEPRRRCHAASSRAAPAR